MSDDPEDHDDAPPDRPRDAPRDRSGDLHDEDDSGWRGAPDGDPTAPAGPGDVDDVPTVSCERCGREWDLAYELDDMRVGNQAVQQFALDHRRHTGHFPDGVATWRAECRNCPEGAERLSEEPAYRWAETHARHTSHAVDVHHADGEGTTRVESPE